MSSHSSGFAPGSDEQAAVAAVVVGDEQTGGVELLTGGEEAGQERGVVEIGGTSPSAP